MGTRHLIAVYLDGDYRIAQYGQWDGYPQGQGLSVLEFLTEQMDVEQFKKALRNTQEIGEYDRKKLYKAFGADKDGMISHDDFQRFTKAHPELSRDTGADILKIVQDHPDGIKLKFDLDFAKDSLFCEWAYVIDFDKNTFEVYEGFQQEPIGKDERFYCNAYCDGYGRDNDSYYPVKKVAEWSLDALPDKDMFLDTFASDDDET